MVLQIVVRQDGQWKLLSNMNEIGRPLRNQKSSNSCRTHHCSHYAAIFLRLCLILALSHSVCVSHITMQVQRSSRPSVLDTNGVTHNLLQNWCNQLFQSCKRYYFHIHMAGNNTLFTQRTFAKPIRFNTASFHSSRQPPINL